VARPRGKAALGALAATLVITCALAAPPIAAQGSVPAPAGVPSAPQTNLSPYPVLQHLGRWDGTSFVPVPAGSISSGHVVAMTHGWSPGYLAPYQRLQAASPALVTAWTPGLVNGAGQSMLDTWTPVAQDLQAADPGSTIVFFSWVDQSATGDDPLAARNGEDATEVNGHRLATAIDQALAPDFTRSGGQLHLLGHSFGANVATTAALGLREAPRQLTLLDSPETDIALLGGAKNDLRYKLPRLDIGRGPGQTFVDNYISYVGIPFAGYPGLDQVVDVKTAPPPSDGAGLKHSFAIVWYRTSARTLSAGVGMAWSPLLGADDARLGSSYVQPNPDGVLALDEVSGPPAPGVRTQLLLATSPMKVPGDDLVRRDAPVSPPGSTPGARGTTVAPAGGPGVQLGGAAPTTWNLTFSTDDTSLWLDFDVALAGRDGDSLCVFVDGRQRYQAAVAAPAPDGSSSTTTRGAGTGGAGSFVILYDLTPGTHVLSATLTGPAAGSDADRETTATLTHLELSSTADIQRNLTAEQTDALVITALVAVATVAVLFIAFVVYVIVRLRRLAQRRRTRRDGDGDGDGDRSDDVGTHEGVGAAVDEQQ
jgi:hypothetical protein